MCCRVKQRPARRENGRALRSSFYQAPSSREGRRRVGCRSQGLLELPAGGALDLAIGWAWVPPDLFDRDKRLLCDPFFPHPIGCELSPPPLACRECVEPRP